MSTETDIKFETATVEIAEAFIRWPLPESVCADLCATRQGPGRVGTNLLSFIEARTMAHEVCRPIIERLLSGRAENIAAQVKCLRRYAAECFPEIENGQKHFVRVLMESVADELETPEAETSPILAREQEIVELIDERDAAENAADKLASLVLGEPIDWSDHAAKWAEAIEQASHA